MTFTAVVVAVFLAGVLMGMTWGRGQRQKLLKLCQDSLALCEQQEQWIKQTSHATATEIALTAMATHAEWTRPRQNMH